MHILSRGVIALSLAGAVNLASAASIVIDNQSIPGSDIQSISISPSTGNIFINTFDGYTVTKGGGTTPTPTGGVVINSFSLTPSTIAVGSATTVAWNVSNAVSCTPSGGGAGWNTTDINAQLPSGSRTLAFGSVGKFNFKLTCSGAQAGDTVEQVRTLTVTQGDPTPTPTTSNCPSAPLAGSTSSWLSFWDVGFPMPAYDQRFMTVPRTGYHAIQFFTGSIFDNGKLTTIETTQTDGVRLGAISECPGDFDVPSECRYVWGISGGIRWATDGLAGACQLQPNTTYYFNVTYTDGVDPGTTTCFQSPCITSVRHTNF